MNQRDKRIGGCRRGQRWLAALTAFSFIFSYGVWTPGVVGEDLPHPDDLKKQTEHLALFKLVPPEEATLVARVSGKWSRIFGYDIKDAKLYIPHGVRVTVDERFDKKPFKWLRIDGELAFVTDPNGDLGIGGDTIVVGLTGALTMGTPADPIHGRARITIDGQGQPINRKWDPLSLSRGLVSHGRVSIVGKETTPYVMLAQPARRGDVRLTLESAPTNWEAGGNIVVPGVSSGPNGGDDECIIAAIGQDPSARTVVTLARPLQYDHVLPSADSPLPVAYLDRNVVIQSAQPDNPGQRGHVMFMHSGASLRDVKFDGLGRTDHRRTVTDPVVNQNGELVGGDSDNPRGRYAVHFHRAGTGPNSRPSVVERIVVVNYRKLGVVNHESNVACSDSVVYDGGGTAFFTEFGNERGSFRHNLAIHVTGSGDPEIENLNRIPSSGAPDFGHSGIGYWLQAPLVELNENMAFRVGTGVFVNTRLLTLEVERIPVSALPPEVQIAREHEVDIEGGIDPGMVPFRVRDTFVAGASQSALRIWGNQLDLSDGIYSTVDGFRAENIGKGDGDTEVMGIEISYSNQVRLNHVRVFGNRDLPSGIACRTQEVASDIQWSNFRVGGFYWGIEIPNRGRQNKVQRGSLNNVVNFYIRAPESPGRSAEIGDVSFEEIPPSVLERLKEDDPSSTPWNIYVAPLALEQPVDWDALLAQNSITFNGQQIYYPQQKADYPLPFVAEVPRALQGQTNERLFASYGLAIGGAILPANATEVSGINVPIGPPPDYPPFLDVGSPRFADPNEPYVLVVRDQDGTPAVVSGPVKLVRRVWNLITFPWGRDGHQRAVLVYGGNN